MTDPEALGDLRNVLEGESFVEIPKELLPLRGQRRSRRGALSLLVGEEFDRLFATFEHRRSSSNYWRDAARHWAVRRNDFAAEYDK